MKKMRVEEEDEEEGAKKRVPKATSKKNMSNL